jgi:exonuclease SbcC
VSFEGASDSFDESRHLQVRTEVIDTSKELARLEAIIEESDKRLNQLTREISKLDAKKVLLANAEEELSNREATAEALEFIRTAIRNAGPYVTRALVQTISLEANRIFGEIMNDHSLRLIWNDDYNITLEQAGEQREFSQLSGGEKTAAALSVRLALLRELSRIRVAFFDEPTSNLDDLRRENLASQITQITGFNQLFVISHDDTFERETHHVIHVNKSQGASQVEVG